MKNNVAFVASTSSLAAMLWCVAYAAICGGGDSRPTSAPCDKLQCTAVFS